MPKHYSQKGIIPLFILVAIGVVTLAGGVYVSLKSSNGESGTKSQPNEEEVYDAPIFYIKPPAGWIKQEKDNIITLTAPDKDKEKVGNKTANLSPRIEIYISNQNVTTMDDFVKATKSLSGDVEYLSDKRLFLNGHEAHFLEVKNMKEGVKMHSASYLLIKDGFEFHVKGGTFDSAWDKRKDALLGSISSFRFKQEGSVNEQQNEKKPPIAFSMKEPLDWKKGVASFPDNKSYAVEYEGQEESETGANGKVMTIRPIISITMIYVPENKLYSEQNILQSNNLQKGTFFGKKGYFSEGATKDYKTGVLSKGQSYIFYENDYQIKISIVSLNSTWDKWYPSMKKVIDSFKFL